MSKDKHDRILLAHGGGGKLTESLIQRHILPKLTNDTLAELADSATLNLSSAEVCFTTDSYVVKPLFFNGGDIGKLAVCGTVNDLAVAGARPVAISLALIIEEGLEFDVLDRILSSVAEAAAKNRIDVVTGDTKTVEAGAADGIFINTAGIGVRLPGVELDCKRIAPGDKVVINGTLGDHGLTIISQRKGIEFESQLQSDCASLAGLTCRILESTTGVNATLNEITSSTGLSIEIREGDLPVNPTARAAADMLGFDVMNIANEGKFVAVVSPDAADDCLKICKNDPLGADAAEIGQVVPTRDVPTVEVITGIGGRRIVQMPYGRELPRIC